MTVTDRPALPDGTTFSLLQEAVRRELGRPALVLDAVECAPVDHRITAPSTASLAFARVVAHDGEPLTLRLVVKVLQNAARGLPPQMPPEERARIAATIPWRLEAEVYTGDTAERMPPGIRLPRLYAAVEHPDDRISLWLEDVEPLAAPWTSAELARAAEALGRLTVRRTGQHLPTRPETTLVAHLVENALHRWAIPLVTGDELWAHPVFTQPTVAALRPHLVRLAGELDDLLASLSAVPCVETHGDPTPMNLLRPRSAPDELVLIDWGTAALGPAGWDVVPLVFGPAENGTAAPTDLADRLAVAVPAFTRGLAREGLELPEAAVAGAVRACALIRYPVTSLPLGEAMFGAGSQADLPAYARRKADFVRAVLDVCA